MKVSIIIPTLNEETHLPRLLDSLKMQTFKNFEVIISDANSTDRTREVAHAYSAKVVDGGTISIGRNNGAKNAKGKILIFMDADIEFEHDFLEVSLRQFEEQGLDIGIPLFKKDFDSKLSNGIYHLSDFFKKTSKNTFVTFATCQCVFIKKELFEKVGGFNEGLDIGEDIDFFKKVKKFKPNYNILQTKFKASDRRFLDVGAHRIFLASGIMAFIVGAGIYRRKKLQRMTEKIYGGWGKSKN